MKNLLFILTVLLTVSVTAQETPEQIEARLQKNAKDFIYQNEKCEVCIVDALKQSKGDYFKAMVLLDCCIPNASTYVKDSPKNESSSRSKSTNDVSIVEKIKQNAIKKWGDNYRMVQYEINSQIEAYNKIHGTNIKQ